MVWLLVRTRRILRPTRRLIQSSGKGGSSGYEEGVLRPDLLIVEGGRSLVTNPKRRDREAALLGKSYDATPSSRPTNLPEDLVTGTLESDRSLLLPCDPSPRLLELLVLLDQHWSFKLTPTRQTNRPPEETWPYPLCVVSRTAQDMLAFARSLIEWMGGVIRDSGGSDAVEEMDTQKKRRKGRKGRPTGGALGSNYGALDFRWDFPFFSHCHSDDIISDMYGSLPVRQTCYKLFP